MPCSYLFSIADAVLYWQTPLLAGDCGVSWWVGVIGHGSNGRTNISKRQALRPGWLRLVGKLFAGT